jgi:leucyl aminopeptidase (aminopeptidase T)
MKYNPHTFNTEVDYYIKKLKDKVKDKVTFVILNLKQHKAFYSLAPLSRAIHNLEGDMHVMVIDKESTNLEILKDIWYVYDDWVKKKIKTKKVKALKAFVSAVNKRTKTKTFKEIFKGPDIILKAEEKGFEGTLGLDYKYRWHRKYKWKELLETASKIWKQGYNLKKGEKVGISCVLIPAETHMELPLEDYLDSYSLSLTMAIAAKKFKVNLRIGSSSDRFSLLAKPVRTADLITTLRGCELSKDVDEDVFKKYKTFSKILKIERMDHTQAGFGIHAKGYYGKHFFGDSIGYPSLDKKTRWSSPGQLMLKDRYEPQTALEKRDPLMRYAVTETLPIDIFIETCNLNYNKLRKRSEKIREILNQCEYIRIVGKVIDKHKTDFTVNLISKDKKRRLFTAQDSDVRTIIDKEYYERTKIKAGSYANFPSGETFVTPETVYGMMVGDVVINIDRSYVIPEKTPIIVEFTGNRYKVIKASKKIKKAMVRERNEARQKLSDIEKNQSLTKEVTKIYRKNFWNIGEFAINTNPKAKLCNYLIVNEKIARMIHVALGLGFEPDRKTMYHWDIVVNAPKQKLDIYGVDKKKKIFWVLKKGEFVV